MSIQVKNLNKSYHGNQVLHDINFKCNTGDTLVLLGPSGAGKSTLLRMLNLLERPDSGELEITGEHFNFAQKTTEKEGQALRSKVGMVFQQYNLWPHLSVLDNLIEAPVRVLKQNKDDTKKLAIAHLTQLQLADKADQWPLDLSGGQQQRVAIARALMMKPDVLLFDEPTAALDPEITNQVVTIIKDLSNTGITQIIVTHEVEFARKIASHILYLEQGCVIEFGDKSSFVTPKTKEFAAYLNQ